MEKVMKILTVFILGMSAWSCSGFPVYDYEPSTLKEALRASVAKVNSQVLSPYLFRGFRGAVKQINFVHGDDVYMTIEFSIRETTCRRDSGEDPSTCDFQQGYHVPAAVCRSSVQMSGSQAKGSWVSCRWASSSDSNSTEEVIFGDILRSYRRRNNYLQGRTPDKSSQEQFSERSPVNDSNREHEKARPRDGPFFLGIEGTHHTGIEQGRTLPGSSSPEKMHQKNENF